MPLLQNSARPAERVSPDKQGVGFVWGRAQAESVGNGAILARPRASGPPALRRDHHRDPGPSVAGLLAHAFEGPPVRVLRRRRTPRDRDANAGDDDGGHSARRSEAETCSTRTAGTSQRNGIVAVDAPASCATTKPGTSVGRMPAKVSVSDRATVTAGFANDVDAVNQMGGDDVHRHGERVISARSGSRKRSLARASWRGFSGL